MDSFGEVTAGDEDCSFRRYPRNLEELKVAYPTAISEGAEKNEIGDGYCIPIILVPMAIVMPLLGVSPRNGDEL